MWNVWDVGCSGCSRFGMWDVGCGMFAEMWDVGLQNKRLKYYIMSSCLRQVSIKRWFIK